MTITSLNDRKRTFHALRTNKKDYNGLDYAHTEKYDTYGCFFKIIIFQFYSYAASQLNSRSRSFFSDT